jgi:uncharacterized protein (DUF433 family)
MADRHSYIQTDEHGVITIASSGVTLDSILAAWEQGHSPESIRSQYPALSLVEVYGALTWCLEHLDEVEAYRKRQQAVWTAWRAKAEADLPPVVRRLREMQTSKARGA